MDKRPKLLLTNSEKALRVVKLLREEFGLPENVMWFEVRFEVDEPVKVTCQYHPTESNGKGAP